MYLTAPVKAVVAILGWLALANAFWRMECRGSSGIGRIDPLMNPGVAAEHMHSVFGSSGFSETSGYSELVAGQCTSCIAIEDKSAYWHPSLYFQAENGSFIMVPEVGGMLAYYNLNPSPGENITAFPAGFQMVAGDNYQRNFTLPVPDPPQSGWASDPAQVSQQGLSAKAIGFNCLDYQAPPEGSLFRHFLPDKAYLDANCTDGIRTELSFPSCWDPTMGPTSANNKDHVAYPDLVLHGNCPSSHPVRLPGLFYEVIYDTYSFLGQEGQFVFANGDPTGYGYHGDFIMGWDESVLQSAVNTCTNSSGLVEDCALFTLQSLDDMHSCTFTPPGDLTGEIEEAKQAGGVNSLPGSVQIKSGPAYAQGPATSSGLLASSISPSTVVSETSSSVLSSASSSVVPVAAVALADSPTSTMSTTTTSAAISPPPPTTLSTATLPQELNIVATSYSDMGDGVELELVVVEEDVYVTIPVTTTMALKKRAAPGHGHYARAHGHVI